jgi:hypothetical protein
VPGVDMTPQMKVYINFVRGYLQIKILKVGLKMSVKHNNNNTMMKGNFHD